MGGMIKNVYWIDVISCYYCTTLMKFEFTEGIFKKKSLHIKFNENPSSCNVVVTYGQTGRSIYSLFPILRTRLRVGNDSPYNRQLRPRG